MTIIEQLRTAAKDLRERDPVAHKSTLDTIQQTLHRLKFLQELEDGEIELERADEVGVIQDFVVRKDGKTSYGRSWFEAWLALP